MKAGKRQIVYIDGRNFNSIKTFGKVIKEAFCLGDDMNVKSLDVINDVLYGGYGILNYEEEFTVVWQNYNKSKLKLKDKDLKLIQDIFESNPFINLALE